MKISTSDEKFVRKCIQLAEKALNLGEAPFASIIVKNKKIIATASNRTNKDNDVTKHAEILVMRKVQKQLKTSNLTNCAIYSNCEPCAMCAFMIRELKIKKVVFGIKSPDMGGYSKWKILQDEGLTGLKPYFGKPPLVLSGVLKDEADKTFQRRTSLGKTK